MYTQNVGAHAENLARAYLERHGLVFVTRNFTCRYGEVDLIMLDGRLIVFVEVRYRQRQDYGGALESVDFRKQQKLIRTATFYLQEQRQSDCFARIDVVAMSDLPQAPDTHPQIQWIRSAVEIT